MDRASRQLAANIAGGGAVAGGGAAAVACTRAGVPLNPHPHPHPNPYPNPNRDPNPDPNQAFMFENLTVANQSNVSLSTHVRVNDTSFLNQDPYKQNLFTDFTEEDQEFSKYN